MGARIRYLVGAAVAALVAAGCAEATGPEGGAPPGDASDVSELSDVPDSSTPGDTTSLDGDVGPTCDTAEDCPSRENATATCESPGYCTYECEEGFSDVDGDLKSNGCECESTTDGMEICDGEDNDCDGMVDEGIDTRTDPANCGECGNECSFPNATAACEMGSCVIDSCKSGWGDCDGMASNGCEIDLEINPSNCGSCGNSCDVSDGTATCTMGSCAVDQCNAGVEDCNDDPSDGCETDLQTDASNCGSCGNTCGTQHTTDAGCRSGSCYIDGCESGWGDCDGDLSNGCEADLQSSTSHCGSCGNDCSLPNANVSCQSGSCNLDGCKQGYHNVDGDDSNGCEYQCTVQSQSDPPDVNGTDANCDGIDGIRDRSVFVATPQNGGDDSNSGRTVNDPVATVTEGINTASNCSPKCDVLISAGTYDETVTLVTGVNLYGGYDSTSWNRNPSSNTTVIKGPNKRAVIASNLGGKTVVDGLEIHGKSYAGNGRSTYALWVENTSSGNLELDYVRVEAGDGGDGNAGSDGGGGADGSNGSVGSDNSGGSGGSSSCGAEGGGGGSAWDCGNSSGDRGSAGGDSTGGGYGGAAGTNECGGCSDSGGDGGNGSSGNSGSNGSGGSGPTDQWGSFSSGTFWTGAIGGAGTSGTNGRGGGGGGAGGSDEDGLFCGSETDVGGGGGGGGAGGCAGNGGQPGRPGGGSFAIVLVDSECTIENSTVVLGAGGAGGDGGRGGDGGSAGAGRSGDSYEPEGGTGGAGADGGEGGAGGGGPGGCGGPAVGIAEVGSSNFTDNNLTFNGGSGGAGGAGGAGGYLGGNTGQSQASSGDDGCDGGSADTRSY